MNLGTNLLQILKLPLSALNMLSSYSIYLSHSWKFIVLGFREKRATFVMTCDACLRIYLWFWRSHAEVVPRSCLLIILCIDQSQQIESKRRRVIFWGAKKLGQLETRPLHVNSPSRLASSKSVFYRNTISATHKKNLWIHIRYSFGKEWCAFCKSLVSIKYWVEILAPHKPRK